MSPLFRRTPIYIKISTNRVEIVNLDNNQSIARTALAPFSTTRLVLADFNKASETIDIALRDLFPGKSLFPRQQAIVIQQVEPVEDGLAEIEKRALRDLGEQAGGTVVVLVDHFRPLSNDEALGLL